MVEITSVALFSDRRGWAVDVALEGRRELRRYRYDSEAQARFFASVFALKPTSLPEGHVRVRRSAGQAAHRRAAPLSPSVESIEAAITAELELLGEDAAENLAAAFERLDAGAENTGLDDGIEDEVDRAFGELELGLCG